MLKWNLSLVTGKNEGSYGTDATPTGTNALLARNVRWKALAQELDARMPALPFFGDFGKAVVRGWHEVAFVVEIAGAGAAGTAPGYGPWLKACGMSETINAGVSVMYAPVSSGESSLTQYFYVNGKIHKMVGAMGSVALALAKGRVPVFQFRFIGLYVIPADGAIVTPTLTPF